MKTIALSIALLLSVSMIQAQSTLPYKALSTFANDTTAFMKYNYKDRADYYKGKTVNDVLTDLSKSNVSVKSYINGTVKNKDTKGKVMITLINIYIYDGVLVGKKLTARLNGKNDKINTIRIYFETPIEYKPNESLLTNNKNGSWKTEIKNFFAPMKIKEIKFR